MEKRVHRPHAIHTKSITCSPQLGHPHNIGPLHKGHHTPKAQNRRRTQATGTSVPLYKRRHHSQHTCHCTTSPTRDLGQRRLRMGTGTPQYATRSRVTEDHMKPNYRNQTRTRLRTAREQGKEDAHATQRKTKMGAMPPNLSYQHLGHKNGVTLSQTPRVNP